MSSQDSENNQELVETNRNLSAAMDKIEMRCKILEEKSEKLKKFKRMIKNSISLQCAHCQKSISQSIFNQHLSSCTGQQQENVSQSVAMYQRQSSAMLNVTHIPPPTTTPSIQNLDLSLLQISINQTMVRETSDNKPYTEYMIKVQYGDKKWTVSRRYKNFCELHQQLQQQFPGLKLPDSQQAIISVQDINNIFQSKRPTVIEDRRKALQQYIRELAKIDIIRNCKCYKKFLDMETDSAQESVNQSSLQIRSISQVNSPCSLDIQQLQSSRDQMNMKDLKWKQSTQPASTPVQQMGPPRNSVTGKDISLNVSRIPLRDNVNNPQPQSSYRIDKKMLPQSPQSFLKSWNEKQNGEKMHRENTQRFTSDHNIYMNNNFQ